MATNRTISIRLSLDEAAQFRQQLEAAGTTGSAALDKLQAKLNGLGATDTAAVVSRLEKVAQAAQAAAAATSQAQFNSQLGVRTTDSSTDQANYAARATQIEAYGRAMDQARASIDNVFAASKSYEAELDRIDAAERTGAASAELAAAARERATAAFASSNSALGEYNAASKAAAAAAKSEADALAAAGAAADAKRAKYSPLYAATKQYETVLREVAELESAGTLSEGEASQARARATQGMQAATNEAARFAAGAKLSSYQVQNLSYQFNDLFTSISTGASPMQALLQQGGQITQVYGGVGNTIKAFGAAMLGPIGISVALVAALVAMGVAAQNQATRMADLRQSLRATHDDYSSLADAVDASAKRVAASSALTRSAAQAIGSSIASSRYLGQFAGDLDALTKSAADYAKVAGIDGPAAAKLFREAIDSPAAAAATLASQGLPAMDAALLRVIQRLDASGKSGEATKLVLEAIGKGSKGAADDLSPLGESMKKLHEAFNTVGQDGKSFATNVGDIIDLAVSKGINAIAGLITALKNARDYAQNLNKGQGEMTPQSYGAQQADAQNAAINSVSPVSSAIAKADPSIQAALKAAADREHIDVELLARLQVYENARVQADGTWKRAGAYADSATGPMQIKPSTFGGVPGFAGQDINDPTVNVAAGAKLFARLLNKYGDVKLAVLAYHDGEGAVDDILAGRRSASDAGSKEANTVTGGYTGTGFSVAGRPAVTPSSAMTGNGMGNDLALPGEMTAAQVAAIAAAQKAALNNGAALPESVQKLLKPGGDGTMFQTQQNAADAIKAITAAMADLRAEGQPTGDTMDRLQALLAKAKQESYGAVNAFDSLHRANVEALGPLQQMAGAQRTVAEAVATAREQMKAQGLVLSDQQAGVIASDTLKKLAAGYNDLVKAADLATASNKRISDTLDQSAPSLIAATNQEKALAAARDAYLPGPEQEAAIARYTAALNRQTASAADLASVQKSFDQRDQLQVLAAETASLGQNEDLRTKELALLQAKQALIKSGADLDSAASRANLKNVAAIADATAAYAHQKETLAEVSGFFDNTFSTIGNAITSAFATGELAAIKFGDIAKSVASAIVAEFVKLALLNPLKNALFGSTSTTLGDVGGLLGGLFGGGTGTSLFTGAVAAGSGIANALSSSNSSTGQLTNGTTGNVTGAADSVGLGTVTSVGGAVLKGADFLSGGKLLSSAKDYVFKAVGFTPGQSLGSWVSELIGEVPAGTSAAASAATAATGIGVNSAGEVTGIAANASAAAFGNAGVAIDAAGNVVSGAAEVAGAAANTASAAANAAGEITNTITSSTTGVIGAAANTVLEALPYIGAAVSIVTDLVTGNYRGAAIVATTTAIGAAVGSIVPGLGTAIGAGIGATVGVLYDTFFPAHKKNPYQDTALDVVDGRLQRGKQFNQLEKLDAASAQVAAFADGLNSYMDAVGIKLANANGTLGHVGNGIKGLTQVDDVSKLFPDLRFDTDPNAADAASNFGIARHALADTSFANPDALNAELIKIASFADAMDALGVHLQAVGKDLTGISIASVDLTDAMGQGSDLRTALEHDLPGQKFENVEALSAEIEKVNQFVNGTMQSLIHPMLVATSSFIDSLAANHKVYDDAIAQAAKYGLDTTALQAGRQAADELLYAPQRKALDQQNTANTLNTYSNDFYASPATKMQAQLAQMQITGEQGRDALIKSLKDVYGDAVMSTDFFINSMTGYNVQFAKSAESALLNYQKQTQTSALALNAQFSSLDARQYTLQGNNQAAELVNFDAKAAQEKDAFGNSMADFYGESYRKTADYQFRMTELENVQQGERLAIVQKYGAATTGAISTAMADALKQAQQNVGTLFTNLTSYVNKLQTGSSSPLSANDQYAYATGQFQAVSGAAAAGDYKSATQLSDYSDTFLAASRAVNGSGAGYVADYQKVLDAVSNVSTQSEALTASSQREIMQSQTDQVVASIADLKNELVAALTALRRATDQQTRVQAAA